MTVSSSTQDVTHDTDGITTVFPVPFYFLRDTDIVVDQIDRNGALTELELGTDFSVQGAGDIEGGELLMLMTPPTGLKLHIYRIVPVTQETEWQQNDPFPAKTTETAFDKLTMIAQQMAAAVLNSVRYPINEYGADGTLPPALERAMTVLGFDELGQQTMLPIPASVGAGDLRDETFVSGVDFTGGATVSINLSRNYGNAANISVYFDGGWQAPDQYTLAGNVLTFIAPIPTYVNRVYVKGGTKISLYAPATGSVGDAELQWGSTLGRMFDTVAQLRSSTDARYSRVFLNGALFKADPMDTTTADDGIFVIVDAMGRRWKSPLESRLSAYRCGAKCDGVTDDTAAITAGINALGTIGGGTIFFPPSTGLCLLNGLVVNKPNITFEGNGSQASGLYLKTMVQVKQPRFTAQGLYVKRHPAATWTGDDFSSGFVVYNKDPSVAMRGFKFLNCEFLNFFFAVAFVGEFDYLAPSLGPQHSTNPVFDTFVMWCKSTAPLGMNSGHFQHLMCRNSLAAFNQTYNGQNCSSYNFYRDCRNVRIIGNYDDSSAWGGCEVENSPLGNALIMGNNFMSTLNTQYASIWVDDSMDCRVIGNECTWDILVTCGNVADDASGGLYPGEITAQTKAQIQSNTCRGLAFSQFSSYVSGSVKADAIGNKVTGTLSQGLFTDGKYAGGRIAHNDFSDGTFTYSMNIARWAGLVVNVHDNAMGVAPAFPGTGGIVRAYNNDATFTEQAMRNDNGVAVLGNKILSTPFPKSFQAIASSTGTFAFATPEDVSQYSVTDYRLKLVLRNAGNGDADVVEFNVMVENLTGTGTTCTVTALTKRRSNTASNIGIVASHANKVLLIAVQNLNTGSNTLTVAATAEGMLRI